MRGLAQTLLHEIGTHDSLPSALVILTHLRAGVWVMHQSAIKDICGRKNTSDSTHRTAPWMFGVSLCLEKLLHL